MKLIVILGFLFFDSPVASDSLGVETINGKTFVIHKVDEKETLFGISKRYGATIEAIIQYNAGAKSGIEPGLILKIPYEARSAKTQDGKIHKVAPKETLYSISRLYGVTTDEIKQWNNLTDANLSVGQELIIKKSVGKPKSNESQSTTSTSKSGVHIVAEKETMYSITRQYGITLDQLKQWNNLTGNELKVGQSLVVADPAGQKSTTVVKSGTDKKEETGRKEPKVEEVKKVNPTETKKETVSNQVPNQTQVTREKEVVKEQPTIKISESVTNSDEILETGLAELIEGTEGNRKYLALHRTAPVGTILKVRNEMNNREVFVRVMGKLPDTTPSDKVILRISKSAYDRLGAIDPRFRVEVTYYK